MFTGIVEHVGVVQSLLELDTTATGGSGWSLTITEADPVLTDCNEGDSISINGTCLTVTEWDSSTFKVGLAPETLRRTNLGLLKTGDPVNLERAMRADRRFGGHFVQGHVDTTATIVSRTPENNSLWLRLRLDEDPKDPSMIRYIIPKGFISLDGTSLTVCDVDSSSREFSIMLIAYTQTKVILSTKDVGDKVNIEVDMLGKYVDSISTSALSSSTPIPPGIESLVRRVVQEELAKR
ncbi:MAG: Lumazine-binding protein [Piptocephalis tieghemiana]|nr:MAG: Lumazine-binding protein [Piptocephalis tieghemiana]